MLAIRNILAGVLACLLTCAPAPGQQSQSPQRLRIIPLEGQNAVNYIQIRTATAPVVEVRDENDRPVEGAAVEFKLPASGPGATFEGGQTIQKAVTDYRGQAGAKGYTINDQPGRFIIDISAAYQGSTGRFVMTQVNSTGPLPPEFGGPAKRSSAWKWILLGAGAAAGAGLGIYFGTHSDPGPISVGTGPVTIGGPR
jgi:hypothetical protein